jgi:hypothetical protein
MSLLRISLWRQTLEEEKATDKKLTELASRINLEAVKSESEEAQHSKRSKAARMLEDLVNKDGDTE